MRITFFLAALALFGCGGSTSTAETVAVSDAATTQDAALPLDGGMVPGRNPDCPATVPAAGGACNPVLACDYASDEHHVCVTHADCASIGMGATFKWIVTVPPDGCGANSASCPASFTALPDGAACPGMNPSCTYPEGRCGCLPCSSEAGMSSMWTCRKWGPDDQTCPSEPPLGGDACTMTNKQCSYGGFCGVSVGPSMMCEDGYWRRGGPTGSCLLRTCGAQ